MKKAVKQMFMVGCVFIAVLAVVTALYNGCWSAIASADKTGCQSVD
jgi:hypothetical protein